MTAPAAEITALVASRVRDVPDFPEAGVVFKDISPLLADHRGFTAVIAALSEAGRDATGAAVIDKVAGIEARGFILAAPVALALGAGFVPVRKAGKLPGPTYQQSYALEYAEATLEVHQDAFAAGERVLLIDDVLATGGTLEASAALVERAGGKVHGMAVLIELGFLHGRDRVVGRSLSSLLTV
jgi:adenine phosphoribosyltransferase